MSKISRPTELAFEFHADVGREFAGEFVAQSQTELRVGQTGTDAALWIDAAIEVHLETWLQDQALRQQQLVFGFEAERRMARLADVHGRFDVELVRREALHAERSPGAP